MQTFMRPLSKDEEASYLTQCKSGNPEARNKLVLHNLRLVAHIVKKYQTPNRCVEDMISIGTIGLIKAIDTYSFDKGNRLSSYAARCIENELLMRLRQERKEAREVSLYEPIGTDKEGNEIRLMDIISTDSEHTLYNIMLSDNLKHISKIFYSVLDEREQKVIALRYGLYGNDELVQKDVAKLLGISRSYVSRIEKKALLKLKSAL